jgi:hypothetical protein
MLGNYRVAAQLEAIGYKISVRTSQETHFVSTTELSLLGDGFTFLYVDDVRTSQEAYASTACYVDSFTFSYVDDVCTSQEIHLWASTACYGDSFTYYMYLMFAPDRKHF